MSIIKYYSIITALFSFLNANVTLEDILFAIDPNNSNEAILERFMDIGTFNENFPSDLLEYATICSKYSDIDLNKIAILCKNIQCLTKKYDRDCDQQRDEPMLLEFNGHNLDELTLRFKKEKQRNSRSSVYVSHLFQELY